VEPYSLAELVHILSHMAVLTHTRIAALKAAADQMEKENKKTKTAVDDSLSTCVPKSECNSPSEVEHVSTIGGTDSSVKNSQWMDSIQCTSFQTGTFYHESQVETYLNSYEMAFDGEIACPFHFEVSFYANYLPF
jgi:hypothetical protein